ncbi:FadR/GntR family transcriptional regulator [Acidocella aminolytica]|uniref:FadR/GntR family transcriptional regulator n=1 Tax=Acidocella aminolytica TaxID=33998 RepID=UPI0006623BD0|nr:FadR/GntR family transcriptional regulator [Acidocella aminolytica]
MILLLPASTLWRVWKEKEVVTVSTPLSTAPPGFGQLPRAARLADQLYEQIVAQIIDGTLPEGERLPSEAKLCELYGVSRPVVREAIFRLQADGLVHTRHGAGTYVAKRPRDEFLRLAPIGGMADLMRCYELRIALEGEAAALAALRQQPESMARIDDALMALDNAVASHEIGVEADHLFHVAIACATQNELFIQSLDALSAHIFAGMHVARSLSLAAPDPARLQAVQAEHRAIAGAIRAHDAEAARQAMRAHIDNARSRILASV